MGLSDVVKKGGLRESLEAQRDDLATRLEVAADREAAGLHRQLSIVLEKLNKLPTGREVTPLDRIASGVADELAARRSAKAAGSGRPAGG